MDHAFAMPVNYELCGILLGLAIYNSVNLDLHFPSVLYKKLLDEPVSLEDVEEIEPELYKGLKHIREYQGDLQNDLYQNFQVRFESFGETKTHDLCVIRYQIFNC
jgi:hypothetical protein